jgi:hypothetical protein
VTLDWNPIRQRAIERAEALGHKLGPFDSSRAHFVNGMRMAECETCHGCCWITFQLGSRGGFKMGGRLLKYKCGTPEAMGLLRTEETNANRN